MKTDRQLLLEAALETIDSVGPTKFFVTEDMFKEFVFDSIDKKSFKEWLESEIQNEKDTMYDRLEDMRQDAELDRLSQIEQMDSN